MVKTTAYHQNFVTLAEYNVIWTAYNVVGIAYDAVCITYNGYCTVSTHFYTLTTILAEKALQIMQNVTRQLKYVPRLHENVLRIIQYIISRRAEALDFYF